MSAISYARMNAIQTVLNEMFDRACHYHSTPALTTRDIFEMLVKPEDIPRLERLEGEVKSLGIYGAETSLSNVSTNVKNPIDGKSVSLHISLQEPIRGLLPGYATQGFHKKIKPEHAAAVTAWVETRAEIGKKFANIYSFINALNEEVGSLAAIKFYFEGITALFEQTEYYKDVADRLREAKLPGKVPSISPEMRRYGITATKDVSWALLFPVIQPKSEPVSFSIYRSAFSVGKSEFKGHPITIW